MLAGLAGGLLLSLLRELRARRHPAPATPSRESLDFWREPLLGYDGMDQETLIDWLSDSELDEDTIERILRYEEANRRRAPVLEALEGMLA
jgi:hypothetical protein